jgi:lysophospholipid acyltransferase (LPLAT)-like uncharacterized protein
MKLLFRTLRREFRTIDVHRNPYTAVGSERFLYAVWHDSMVMPAFGGKHIHSAALTSKHQDGYFVSSVLKNVGMSSVRGSTGKGGGGALRELMTTARDKHIVITPDGPRGPRRTMSPGIVFLASHTGRSIVPTAFACVSAWKIRGSWTDLKIPKPFSTVYFLAGEPVPVPAGLSREGLQAFTAHLQDEMDRLDSQANDLVRAA